MSGINPDGTLIKFPTPKPTSPAAIAASTGDIKTLSSPEMKPSLWVQDEHGNIPLVWAADKGHADALKYLLEHIQTNTKDDISNKSTSTSDSSSGIINTRGYLGNTALGRAARGGHSECVKLLLERNEIDPNIANEKKQYPLHFAAFKKHPEVVNVFLESGKCDTRVLDRKGRTPAEDTRVDEIREMILKYRASLVK
mmetsp:Transcript_25555/g.29189  ORF Transcript_25555/g.29189 Transcript_25555/m.29189 type:complete len:197 (-) Transcript_25555:28-618(-)